MNFLWLVDVRSNTFFYTLHTKGGSYTVTPPEKAMPALWLLGYGDSSVCNGYTVCFDLLYKQTTQHSWQYKTSLCITSPIAASPLIVACMDFTADRLQTATNLRFAASAIPSSQQTCSLERFIRKVNNGEKILLTIIHLKIWTNIAEQFASVFTLCWAGPSN